MTKSIPSDAPASAYFHTIEERVTELDTLGQAYLDSLPFMPSDTVAERIWNRAWEIFHAHGSDWNSCPEPAIDICDNGVPFTSDWPSRNGSIFGLISLSLVSKDAHLRNLLERIEGRTNETLPFPVCAEQPEITEPITRPRARKLRRVTL